MITNIIALTLMVLILLCAAIMLILSLLANRDISIDEYIKLDRIHSIILTTLVVAASFLLASLIIVKIMGV